MSEAWGVMRDLRLVFPGTVDPAVSVRFEARISGTTFHARFEVRCSEIFVNPDWSLDSAQWGLWDRDVVEVFLAVGEAAAGLPYYEFQISPLGQYFELEIFEPRKRFNRGYRSGFSRTVQKTPEGWTADFAVPLVAIGWMPGQNVIGNAFACLGGDAASGGGSSRSYWSLSLPSQAHLAGPDFHLPEFFRPLV